jgi:methylated-DNA-protein-cysteine methyltransferase-like protein
VDREQRREAEHGEEQRDLAWLAHATEGNVTLAMSAPTDHRRQRILATIDSIPRGRVATYGGVALEAGLPRYARYVARVLGELPAGHDLPWFRVIGAGGRLRTSGASARLQARLLRGEGVALRAGKVDLDAYGWPTSAPRVLGGTAPAPAVRKRAPRSLAKKTQGRGARKTER